MSDTRIIFMSYVCYLG